jgi:hypothetical protein
VAQRDTETVKSAHDSGIITTQIALKELKQASIQTGRFTNITDEDIEESEAAPPPWEQPDPMMGGMPGGPGKANGAGGNLGAGVPKATVPKAKMPVKEAGTE